MLRLPPPAYRDPLVSTPLLPGLPPARPVGRRAGPWVASFGALAIAALVAVGQIQSTTSDSSSVDASVVCLDESGYTTRCDGADAAWQIDREVTSATDCLSNETVFTDDSASKTYCATRR